MTQESFLLGFPEATYKGNIMGDAYTAMALLSEKFYRAYVTTASVETSHPTLRQATYEMIETAVEPS
jgi:hypothetical protein